jgi:redox-sensing transcriptional repressor
MIGSRLCIQRLSQYRNALGRFKTLGFVKVFSDNLADAVGVTSVQVRKDFSLFGISGNKKGGYKIEQLIEQLNEILGKNEVQQVILVGAGNIGAAMMKYKGFENEGIKIVAGFDINPTRFQQEGSIPVLPIEELREFIKNNHIRIGIIAVPDVAAPQVFDMLVSAGIKGVLNFAPIRLRETDTVVVNNVNIALELENLIYFVNIVEKVKK